jgi:hypothetical protein
MDQCFTPDAGQLSWKCWRFRCRPQLVLTTWCRVFPTRRPDTADVSATSCDVGFFFSVSYVVSLPNCRHVVVVTTHYVPYTPCVSDLDQETGTNLHTQERNKTQRSSCSPVLFGAICHLLLFVTFSLAPHKKCLFFPWLGALLYEMGKKYASTTQNTTTQHTTINMSRSRPTLQRLCPLSLHG